MPQNNRRGSAPQFGAPPSYTPAPIKSDTYTPPQQYQPDTRLNQLANALGAFNSSLVQAGKYHQEAQGDASALIAARAINGMTHEQAADLAFNGDLPLRGVPAAQLAVGTHAGRQAAVALRERIENDIQQGNISLVNDDVEAYVQGLLGEQLAALEGRPESVINGFLNGTDGLVEDILGLQDTALDEQFEINVQQTIMDTLTSTGAQFMEGWMPGGDVRPEGTVLTPNEFATWMQSAAAEMQESMLRTPEQMEAFLINYAGTIADTRPDLARALLTTGIYSSGQGYTPSVENINQRNSVLAAINQAEAGILTATSYDQVLNANLQTMVNGGTLQAVRDWRNPFNGEVVSRETQERDAWIAYREWLDDQPMDYETRIQTELAVAQRNGIVHEEWKGVLEALPGQINDQLLSDPEAVGNLINGELALYNAVRNYSPSYLASILNQETLDWFDVYETALDGGRDPGQALEAAYQVATHGIDSVQIPESQIAELTRQAYRELEQYTSAWFDTHVAVDPQTSQRIYDQAILEMRLGSTNDPEQAVKNAVERMAETEIRVNNYSVDVRQLDVILGDDFPAMAEAFMQDQFDYVLQDLHPELEFSDLRLQHTSSTGQFVIVDARSGIPIEGANGVAVRFSVDDVATLQQRMQDRDNAAAVQEFNDERDAQQAEVDRLTEEMAGAPRPGNVDVPTEIMRALPEWEGEGGVYEFLQTHYETAPTVDQYSDEYSNAVQYIRALTDGGWQPVSKEHMTPTLLWAISTVYGRSVMDISREYTEAWGISIDEFFNYLGLNNAF